MTRALSSAEVCQRAGVTFRQLDYWHRAGLFPDVDAGGSGTRRLWRPRHVAVAALWKSLHHLGADRVTCGDLADWITDLPGPWSGLLVIVPDQLTGAGRKQRVIGGSATLLDDGLDALNGGGAWVVDLAWCWQHASQLVAVA